MLLPPHPDQDSYDWWFWTESPKIKAKIIGPPPNPLRPVKPVLLERIRRGKVRKHSQSPVWYQSSKVSAPKRCQGRCPANRRSRTRKVITLPMKHAYKLRTQALAEKEFNEALDALVDLFANSKLSTVGPAQPVKNEGVPAASTATQFPPAASANTAVDPDTPDEMDSERDPLAIAREWSDNLAEDAKNLREREDAQIERERDYAVRLEALMERENALKDRGEPKPKRKRMILDLTDDDHVRIKTEPIFPGKKDVVDLTDLVDDHAAVKTEAVKPKVTPMAASAKSSVNGSADTVPKPSVQAEHVVKHGAESHGEVVSTTTTTTTSSTITTITVQQKMVPCKRKRAS